MGEASLHSGAVDNPTEQHRAEAQSGREKQSAAVTTGSDTVEITASEGDPAEGSPFVLGDGLPTVPAKLVKKILKGDYVDMAELLQDNIEAARRQGNQPAPSTRGTKHPRREVPDILSWLQCFGAYASSITHKQPGRVRMLWAYQTTIVRETLCCGGQGWRAYDTMFRQLAASSPKVDWVKINSSIYAVTFLAQSSKGKMCHLCLEADHGAKDCALATA